MSLEYSFHFSFAEARTVRHVQYSEPPWTELTIPDENDGFKSIVNKGYPANVWLIFLELARRQCSNSSATGNTQDYRYPLFGQELVPASEYPSRRTCLAGAQEKMGVRRQTECIGYGGLFQLVSRCDQCQLMFLSCGKRRYRHNSALTSLLKSAAGWWEWIGTFLLSKFALKISSLLEYIISYLTQVVIDYFDDGWNLKSKQLPWESCDSWYYKQLHEHDEENKQRLQYYADTPRALCDAVSQRPRSGSDPKNLFPVGKECSWSFSWEDSEAHSAHQNLLAAIAVLILMSKCHSGKMISNTVEITSNGCRDAPWISNFNRNRHPSCFRQYNGQILIIFLCRGKINVEICLIVGLYRFWKSVSYSYVEVILSYLTVSQSEVF